MDSSNKYRHFLDDELVCIPRALVNWRVNIHAHLARAPREPQPLTLEALTRIRTTSPGKHMCHIQMWNFEKRLKTLKDIASSLLQGVSEIQLKDMANAGFFYSGQGNTLICAHCGNILHDWVEGDCPWKRHAELNSKCPLLTRGCSLDKAGEVTSLRKRHSSGSAG
ncbi:E3 ubiquitin-protein ligase XIAP-like isoform X2 [Haliotis rubra]|nr:E3 ubiquitin-protein ligase XIAP-like isoform X2 [Haliotis rubra]XP_046571601.1 E3 ubiquitin-protein ligase XIAP-like isoform X2 [Haliotis rubra]